MNGFLAKIYGFKALDDLILIYPLYAVMFVEHGMSATQLALLLTIWTSVALALEVPSGILADHYSRKHLLFVGQVIRAAGYLAWLVMPGFWGFAVGFVCWGIKSGLTSGTFEALVYDELKAAGRARDYAKVIGRANGAGELAFLAAALGAAAVAPLGYAALLGASVAAVLGSAVAVIALPKARRAERTGDPDYLAHLWAGTRVILHDRVVLKLASFSAMVTAVWGALDEFWGVFGSQVGLAAAGVAAVFAGVAAAQAAGAALAHRAERLGERALYGMVMLAGLLLGLAAVVYTPAATLALVALSFVLELVDNALDARFHHAIPDETRATVASLRELALGVGAIGVYLVFGAIAEVSYRAAFAAFAAVMVGIAVAYLVAGARR